MPYLGTVTTSLYVQIYIMRVLFAVSLFFEWSSKIPILPRELYGKMVPFRSNCMSVSECF